MGIFNDIANKIDNIFNINNYNILSYAHILKDIQNFKRAGTINGDEFNHFDTPSLKYFKILFYFGKDATTDEDGGFSSGGLLTPTWNEYVKNDGKNLLGALLDATVNKLTKNKADDTSYIYSETKDSDNFYKYNSAWAYLMLNDEKQRAEHLEQFVNLLSNINSESPWYFYSIEGLNEALERKPASDGKFEFGDTKKLTIKCLPDAFDNRITTLLDLYRDITWSWNMKREILPANLRKFDMAIYIFEAPVAKWHEKDVIGKTRRDITKASTDNNYITSYKMLEFHNCEFDYNSIKSGWSTLSNEKGVTPEYSIDIKYDDCYEISYNEFMMRTLGDIIFNDIMSISYAEEDNKTQTAELNRRLSSINPGFLQNAIGQLIGEAKNYLEDKITEKLLGNIHSYSLTNISSQIKSAMKGNLIQTVQAAKDYVNNSQKRKEQSNISPNGNITKQQAAALKIKEKPSSNIFKNVTVVNNI